MKETSSIDKKEKEILDFWKRDKIFEKSLEKTKDKKPYIFYDGPPFATGLPHQGSLLGSITKDVFGRFWTMKGRYVKRVWGWDCHGLPIETIAEKGLGINSKDEIEKIGVKKFNDYCRSKVLGYTKEWEDVIDLVGRWVDMKNPYKTMDNSYIESVWWAFKRLYEKGFIYEGEKILMYCPRCSTPLAKAEIAMDNSYKTIKEDSIVVRFKLKDEGTYILAWTTTPWTLPSNLALAVNPNFEYALIKDKEDNNKYILAKELIKKYYKNEESYEILEEIKGKNLKDKEYEPLFPYFSKNKNSFRILLGDFVTAEDGTGIVHIAPAFGEDDYEICKKNKISLVQPIDEKGKFTKEVKDFKGEYVHEVNQKIIDFLKKEKKIASIRKISHEYPFCYRCETKLIYRAIPAWFVDIQKIKPRILELNKKLNWYPEFLKEGRVKYTLETAPDWNISRNRYWASAMPVWVSKDNEKLIIGSIEELKKYSKDLTKEIDLHKDFLDRVTLYKDGKEFRRIPEVLDCWFESASMPFAQFHYPFENKEFFEKNFPAQFVAEYIGQVRAWFYYMIVLSTMLFDEIPFENIVTTGTVLAEDGQKISKSKNNYTDPTVLFEKYGADAFRLYLMSSPVMNAENLKFSDSIVEENYKKTLLLLYNVSNFYKIYEKILESKKESKNVLDRWIISRLNNLKKSVSKCLEEYNTVKSCSEIKEFVNDLSTWYVRSSRERFNEEDEDAKKTLHKVLEDFSKIIAPIIPFISEIIYRTIDKKESVHLSSWPKLEEEKIDDNLEEEMRLAREIVSVILRERDREKIGIKWPLQKATITSPKKINGDLEEVIREETNIKELKFKIGKDLTIVLDTVISRELESEGFSREIIRKVQEARKKEGLVKEDEIEIEIISEFKEYLEEHEPQIKERIGAKKIYLREALKEFNYSEEGKIKDKKFTLKLKKI